MTYFVTAIGAPVQKYDDMLGHGDTKTQRKNTLRASRLGLRCRPTASSAFSVSQCLCGLSKSIRQHHYEMLYLEIIDRGARGYLRRIPFYVYRSALSGRPLRQ